MILNKNQIEESNSLMDLRETAIYYLGQLDKKSTATILTGKLNEIGVNIPVKVTKKKITPTRKGRPKR
jgi:hypothetical protein